VKVILTIGGILLVSLIGNFLINRLTARFFGPSKAERTQMAMFVCAALIFVIAVILSGYTLELKMNGVVAMGRLSIFTPAEGERLQ
jgi:hypothetical protein